MLYIEKKGPDVNVRVEISRVKRDCHWDDTDKDDAQLVRSCFDTLDKTIIKAQLLKEQHGLCAYCMKRIRNNNHMVIEHLVPVQQSGADALSYFNMLGCCEGGRLVTVVSPNEKILCCDAAKGNQLLHLSPLDKIQMQMIRYDRNGRIFTSSKDKEMEHDINEVLHLNGIVDKATGNMIDTSTCLVKGRKDVYDSFCRFIEGLSKKNKLTKAVLEKKVKELECAEEYMEYVGVWLFFLKRKIRAIR